MFVLCNRSQANLQGVHPDLQAVVKTAAQHINGFEFVVTEGIRTKDRQIKLVSIGASTTMNSRHLTGHAVDLAAVYNGAIRWDWPLYFQLAYAMKNAAAMRRIPIEWGGDWDTFKDGPHFQLPWDDYPATLTEVSCVDQTLTIGTTGSCVEKLQRHLTSFLRSFGIQSPIKIDGHFGNETEDFVKVFKRINKLPNLTIVDPSTWNALTYYAE